MGSRIQATNDCQTMLSQVRIDEVAILGLLLKCLPLTESYRGAGQNGVKSVNRRVKKVSR